MGIEKLQKELSESENEIKKNKIAIADLFLEIYHSKSSEMPTFDEFVERMKKMSKMPSLIAKLEESEIRYNTMLDSLILIESAISEN